MAGDNRVETKTPIRLFCITCTYQRKLDKFPDGAVDNRDPECNFCIAKKNKTVNPRNKLSSDAYERLKQKQSEIRFQRRMTPEYIKRRNRRTDLVTRRIARDLANGVDERPEMVPRGPSLFAFSNFVQTIDFTHQQPEESIYLSGDPPSLSEVFPLSAEQE